MTSFKKGDAIVVLDDDLRGVVKNVEDQIITVETEEGFELSFSAHELIHQKASSDMHDSIFENVSLSDVVDEKEMKKRKPTRSKKAKERYEPTLEVDLHIHHLTNSTRGMTNHDMLTLQLDFAIRKRIQKVVFIHGVGEGVLKLELEYLFGRYNNLRFYDANYRKYGLGATEVYIYQNSKP